MLKRDKLEAMLRRITDKEFNAVWNETYGYVPRGGYRRGCGPLLG